MPDQSVNDILKEIRRIPWFAQASHSLESYYEAKGKLTEKQHAYMMSMYLDSCVTSAEEIAEQLRMRKAAVKLYDTMLSSNAIRSPYHRRFISSVATTRYRLTSKQAQFILKLVKQYAHSFPEKPNYQVIEWEMRGCTPD